MTPLHPRVGASEKYAGYRRLWALFPGLMKFLVATQPNDGEPNGLSYQLGFDRLIRLGTRDISRFCMRTVRLECPFRCICFGPARHRYCKVNSTHPL